MLRVVPIVKIAVDVASSLLRATRLSLPKTPAWIFALNHSDYHAALASES